MESGLIHFDISALITFVVGGLISAAAYYIKSTARLSAHASISAAEKRLENLAEKLIERIDAVKEAVVELNVTLARADERIVQSSRDIARLDARLTALEDRRQTKVAG